MEKHYKFYDLSNVENAYVVGDIHGRFDLLDIKLKELNFNKDKDVLFAVGDLVDRGNESRKVIQYLRFLKSTKGNHESLLIAGASDFYYARSHKRNGGEWFYRYSEDDRYVFASELNLLPIAIEVLYKGKRYGIVHADVPGNDWKEFVEKLVKFKGDEHGDQVIQHALWSRSRAHDWFTGYNTHNHAPITNIDQVFVGHTIFLEPLAIHNVNYIDTGAYQTNNLTVVRLDELIQQAPKRHELYSRADFWH